MSVNLDKQLKARGSDLYDYGPTVLYASKADPRFGWTAYVPKDIHQPGPAPQLVVAVHGSLRLVHDYRNKFAEFARWNRCVVLAPLFPAGVCGDDSRDGYKYLAEGDIRYDEILLSMVEELEKKYNLSFPRFALWGFSGGGQFAHRFLMLHPERLWAASIGAPGSVTLLDAQKDWWVGIRNTKDLFGKSVDVEAMKSVAIHMAVGDADLETWEITHFPESRNYMEGANDAGDTRPERLDRLRQSFEAQGLEVAFDVVPGISHSSDPIAQKAADHFALALKTMRAAS